MAEEKLYEFVALIVSGMLTEEVDAFAIDGRELVAAATKGASLPAPRRDEAHNKMGESVFMVLEYVGVIWGTWKMLVDWKAIASRALESKHGPAVEKEWESRLVTAGVPADTARLIAAKYGAQLGALASPAAKP
jgi:hypothetical protein